MSDKQRSGKEQHLRGKVTNATIEAFILSLPDDHRAKIAERWHDIGIEDRRLRKRLFLCVVEAYYLGMEAVGRGEDPAWQKKFTAQLRKALKLKA